MSIKRSFVGLILILLLNANSAKADFLHWIKGHFHHPKTHYNKIHILAPRVHRIRACLMHGKHIPFAYPPHVELKDQVHVQRFDCRTLAPAAAAELHLRSGKRIISTVPAHADPNAWWESNQYPDALPMIRESEAP